MNTMPWQKQTPRDAIFERYLKIRRGIIGYLASFHSLIKKSPKVRIPNTIRQTTVAEFQGWLTPPYSRPRRNIIVPPTTVILPIQSMALKPAKSGVFGVSMSRKKEIMINARPSNGTNRSSVSWRAPEKSGSYD